MNTRFFLFAAVAMTLAACENNELEVQNNANEIRLFTEVAGQTRASTATDLQNTQFAEGTNISVKVTDNATSDAVTYGLVTYTADGSGALSLYGGGSQYFPASGSTVDIIAYHPAAAGASDGAFSVQTNQAGDDGTANYKASDLMWATPLTGVSRENGAQTLSFRHLMSKIEVTLVQGTGVTADEIGAATITLGNSDLITSGTFNTATGEFTAAASGTGTYTIATSAGAATPHAAIIVPQNVAGKALTVTIGETARTYDIPEGTSFVTGKKYTYTLTVNKTGLTVSSTISDWDADGWIDPGIGESPDSNTSLTF